MKVTVEMTDEEFAEYLQFRKTKKIDQSRLNSTSRAMSKLASTVLEAVGYEEPQDEYEIDDDDKLNEAVALANEWFA